MGRNRALKLLLIYYSLVLDSYVVVSIYLVVGNKVIVKINLTLDLSINQLLHATPSA